ncbi:MAG: transcriptional regulator [Meiothermus sp.]
MVVDPAAVEKARAGLPSEALVGGASELLKAVADPTRMRILSALRAAGELCVGDLAGVVGMSESAVSHQLRLLRGVRLVEARKESCHVFYRLADGHVATILRYALEHAGE